MAYILNDPTIFGTKLNPFDVYYLSANVFDADFLAVKWLQNMDLVRNELVDFAASVGNLKCLQYLHDKGLPWGKQTCRLAAAYDHLDTLKYLHEEGCEWDETTCSFAAVGGHLDCLIYIHENGVDGHSIGLQ